MKLLLDIFLMRLVRNEILLDLMSLYLMGNFFSKWGLICSGGRSSTDPLTNIRSLAGSQLCTDRGVSALLSNWRSETPLVLIMGSKCRASPVFLPLSGIDA